ncbi:MAG: hypothetical protein CMK32_10765 [Porticoccaceae bacterium]|nr:hypothetical protein [Porticoccaceae bacterium]
MTTNDADQWQTTVDKQAIAEVIYRYCRAMDRIDHELGYSVWHEDGIADYGDMFQGSGRGFIDWVCETHAAMVSHSHQVTNILIDVNGDRAGSEAYITVALRFEQDGKLMQLTGRGRYIDRWSKRDGRWAIDKRTYVQDFDDLREITATMVKGWSTRDRNDPSYQVLNPAP